MKEKQSDKIIDILNDNSRHLEIITKIAKSNPKILINAHKKCTPKQNNIGFIQKR